MNVTIKFNPTQSFDLHFDKTDSPETIAARITAECGATVSPVEVGRLLGDIFVHGKTSFDFREAFPTASTPTLLQPKPPAQRTVDERSALISGAATSLDKKALSALEAESALLDSNTHEAKPVKDVGPSWIARDAVQRFPLITKQGKLDKILDVLKRIFTLEKTQTTSGLSQTQRDQVFAAAREVVQAHPDAAFAVAMLPRHEIETAIKQHVSTAMPGLSAKEQDKITKYALNGMLSAIPQAEYDAKVPSLTLRLADGREVKTEKKLGSGANGAVFLLALPDGKQAVIKVPSDYVLYQQDSADWEVAYDQSSKEIEVHHHAASLAPLNTIVDFLGVAQTPEGIPLLLCEFVPGKNGSEVQAQLSSLNLQSTDKLDLMRYGGRQKLLALTHAHEQRKILHLDIKPENFMLAQDTLTWKLADFGEGSLKSTSALERAVGSPVFMAPEILNKQASTASDVYSLGVSFFFELTGTYPIDDQNRFELNKKLRAYGGNHGNVMIPATDTRFDAQTRALLNAMLHPDPAQRPTAQQLLAHPLFAPDANGDANARRILAGVVPNTIK